METLISVIVICFQIVKPFLQPCEQCIQPQNHRDVHIFVNIAPRTKFQKQKLIIFQL